MNAATETVESVIAGFLDTLYDKDDRDLVTVLCSGIEQALENDRRAHRGKVNGQTRTLLAVKAASGVLLGRHLPDEFGAWMLEVYGDEEDEL